MRIYKNEVYFEFVRYFVSKTMKSFIFLITKSKNPCVMEKEIPKTISEHALKAGVELLPKKSRSLYERELQKFEDWRNKNSVKTASETVLMAYFHELVRIV